MLFLYKKESVRFSELESCKFVKSRSSISRILNDLKDKNLIERDVIDASPPKTEYTLTTKGEKVSEILLDLVKSIGD